MSHGPIYILSLFQPNIKKYLTFSDIVLKLCKEKKTSDTETYSDIPATLSHKALKHLVSHPVGELISTFPHS